MTQIKRENNKGHKSVTIKVRNNRHTSTGRRLGTKAVLGNLNRLMVHQTSLLAPQCPFKTRHFE
jgi:hypothetical protein